MRWPEWVSVYTYLLLPEGYQPEVLEAKFPAFIEQYGKALMGQYGKAHGLSDASTYRFHLQPLTDIHMGVAH